MSDWQSTKNSSPYLHNQTFAECISWQFLSYFYTFYKHIFRYIRIICCKLYEHAQIITKLIWIYSFFNKSIKINHMYCQYSVCSWFWNLILYLYWISKGCIKSESANKPKLGERIYMNSKNCQPQNDWMRMHANFNSLTQIVQSKLWSFVLIIK